MAYSLENTQDLQNLADAIRAKTGESGNMTIAEMAEAVGDISGGSNLPVINLASLNGNSTGWDAMGLLIPENIFLLAVKKYQIVDDSNKTRGALAYYPYSKTPSFVMPSTNVTSLSNFFLNSKIAEEPVFEMPENLTIRIGQTDSMYSGCPLLKSLSLNWLNNINWLELTNNLRNHGMFQNCYFLRHIENLDKFPNNITVANYTIYRSFQGCFSLHEINNLVVITSTFTTNVLNSISGYTLYKLRSFTFQTNNGSPITANWSNLILNLANAGYSTSLPYVNVFGTSTVLFDSSKFINSSERYNLYKNDPDAWASSIDYSFYNHTSAVETINSLPDVSAGSNNIIIFTGASGALTDGGPISALTSAEIQVATDKGWTVLIQ